MKLNKWQIKISSPQSGNGPQGSLPSFIFVTEFPLPGRPPVQTKSLALQPIGLNSDADSTAAFSCVILGKLLNVSVPLLKTEDTHSTYLIRVL